MKLRTFLNEYLLTHIKRCNKPKYPKQQLFFFQIGSFPSNNNNINHEYPDVITKYRDKYQNLELNLVLIDPRYNSAIHNLEDENSIFNITHDRINNYDLNTYIFEESIDNDEYISLIEFCHFISFYKCLSVVMEFTGIKRLASLKEDNITEYLYITPSDCLINTKDILNGLTGYSFKWNETSGREGNDLGVIAQDVKEVLPQIVQEREDGYLAVDYPKLIPVLIEEVKRLSDEVDKLKSIQTF